MNGLGSISKHQFERNLVITGAATPDCPPLLLHQARHTRQARRPRQKTGCSGGRRLSAPAGSSNSSFGEGKWKLCSSPQEDAPQGADGSAACLLWGVPFHLSGMVKQLVARLRNDYSQSGRRRLSQGHRAGRSTAGGRGASTVSGSTKASMHVRPHIRHEASNPARPRVQKISHSKQPDQSSLFPHRPSDPSPHYYFISGFCCLVLLMCFILQLPAPLQSLN